MRILLDLDEVLADFVGGCLRAHGWTKAQLYAVHRKGDWHMAKAMEINEGDEFWRPIHALGEKFWIDLEPLPWAKALIELVEQYSKDWHVVSSPSQLVESYTGKVKWLKWFFGQSFDRFALTPHKHVFACHNVILIDDREQNIHDFTGSGGYGIVFPTLHNNRWPFADDSLHYVKDRLETICGPR